MNGYVKWFEAKKGYGFIQAEDSRDYFCHYKDIEMEGFRTLSENDTVCFGTTQTDKGRRAINIQRCDKEKIF